MTQPKRILHILEGLHCGGTEAVVMNWYRHIDKTKIQFDFAVYNLENAFYKKEIEQLGGRIFSIAPNRYCCHKTPFEILKNLRKILRKNEYYSVQSHEEQPFFLAMQLIVLFLCGIRKKFTISHVDKNNYAGKKISKVKLFIARTVILFLSNKKFAVSNQAGISMYGNNMQFKILKNGIDCERFSFKKDIRTDTRNKLNLQNNFVIGHVGRFDTIKNQSFLIDVFKKISNDCPEAVLLLTGSGFLKDSLKEKTVKLNIADKVIFLEPLEKIENLYQAMDCFVLPSLHEGFGIVSLEAQCSGLPCFLSDKIPFETNILNTTVIPLNEKPEKWAEIIMTKTKFFKRKDESKTIKESGFDINVASEIIQNYYLGVSK